MITARGRAARRLTGVPALAERVWKERRQDLESRTGRLMALFFCAKVVGPHTDPHDPQLQPARREASRLVAELAACWRPEVRNPPSHTGEGRRDLALLFAGRVEGGRVRRRAAGGRGGDDRGPQALPERPPPEREHMVRNCAHRSGWTRTASTSSCDTCGTRRFTDYASLRPPGLPQWITPKPRPRHAADRAAAHRIARSAMGQPYGPAQEFIAARRWPEAASAHGRFRR